MLLNVIEGEKWHYFNLYLFYSFYSVNRRCRIKFQAISAQINQMQVQQLGDCKIYIKFMKSPISSDNQNTPDLSLKQKIVCEGQQNSSEALARVCKNSKLAKKITKKPDSLLKKLRIENPISFSHVHNIFNVIGINQQAVRDSDYQQSFFKTMFYLKTVQKVELRKHALILYLKSTQMNRQPIQYLVNRYKSFGDKKFYELAQTLEKTAAKFNPNDFGPRLLKSFDSEPLSRFIDSMENQVYMCKVAPNKLVISRPLLELLGEDPESYAVQMCKYKMPMREIISGHLYAEILKKSIENITSISEFVNGKINHDELHSNTSISFNDFLCNRQNKKIYCSLVLFMPTPQITCIQVRQIVKNSEDFVERSTGYGERKSIVKHHCEQMRFKEVQVLKNIIKIPQGLLKSSVQKIAGYKIAQTESS